MSKLETLSLSNTAAKKSTLASFPSKFYFKTVSFLCLVFLSTIYTVSLVSKIINSNTISIYLMQLFNLGASYLSVMHLVAFCMAILELILLILLWFNKRLFIQ